MRILANIILSILIFSGSLMADQSLSVEEQTEIIKDYGLVTGQTKGNIEASSLDASYDSHNLPIKCGTPAIVRFLTNRDKLDHNLLQALGVVEATRPVLDSYIDSDSGHFRIHYATSGADIVYEANVDLNSNGVPDFIDSVAMAADSVWDKMINQLGFPEPVVDTFCSNADGPLIDIYVRNLSGVYGQTTFDLDCAVPGTYLMQVPAFMEIDNDYSFVNWIYPGDSVVNAARVTIAHEFFHIVQGSMDFTEFTGGESGYGDRYWAEMSAVWMEETIYDDINDYYYYLPSFFNQPNTSFQQFLAGDLHPYASVIFPIFLSQKYGEDIVRVIWEKEADLGIGPNFLEATAFAIDSISGGADNYVTAFSEFALWNFFTDFRSTFAPTGLRYEEAEEYPIFPDEKIMVYDSFPVQMVPVNTNPFKPEHNAVSIIRFENTQLVQEEQFYLCVDSLIWYNPICDQDSTVAVEVLDSSDIANGMWDVLDSAFNINGALESMAIPINGDTILTDWSISIVFQDTLDSIEIDQFYMPSFPCDNYSCLKTFFGLSINRVNQYKRFTMIIAPASPYASLYEARKGLGVAYSVRGERMSGDTTMAPIEEGYMLHPQQLVIYPNPAVVTEMSEGIVRFKLDSMDVYGDPFVGLPSVRVRTVLNVFDVAGNIVYSVDTTSAYNLMEFFGEGSRSLDVEWDMKNQSGAPVASGIYVGIAEIYIDRRKVTEGIGKVAIIR